MRGGGKCGESGLVGCDSLSPGLSLGGRGVARELRSRYGLQRHYIALRRGLNSAGLGCDRCGGGLAAVDNCGDSAGGGAQCYRGPGANFIRRDEFEAEARGDGGDGEDGFEHGELIADAAARSGAEGE